VNSMPILVQGSTQVLLSAQKLHSRGLGPCTDLELQFKAHPKHLDVLLSSFGKFKRPPKGFTHVKPSTRIREGQNSRLCFHSRFWTECNPSLPAFWR